jgi:hypothetical protein
MKTFVILSQKDGIVPSPEEIEAALTERGWMRWEGSGDPDIAVFHTRSCKGDYFEAGVWSGRGVHLFFIGGGARSRQRKQIVGRLGGWSVAGENGFCGVRDLLATIERWEKQHEPL